MQYHHVSKIAFIFLMAPVDSTNDRNIAKKIERPELTFLCYISMSNVSAQLY